MGEGTASPSARPRRLILFALAVLAVPAIGVADVSTGPDLGMSLFYLLPVSAAAWWRGRWPGIAVASLAGVTWLYSDVATQATPAGVSLWNAFTRLVIFNLIAVLLDSARREREDLRRTVEGLDTQRARQETLMAALSDAILVVDEGGTVTTANEPARTLLGGTGVVGRPIRDVLPFVTPGPAPQAGRWTGQLTDPFGAQVEVEVSHAPIGGTGGSAGSVYVLHDITHHAALNRMREQLLYSVAHELRGPLGVLENALDLLATEYGDLSAEEYGRLSGSALRNAKRLRTLMEDLLSAGTIQSGRFTIAPEAVALREIVDDAIDTVVLAMQERGQRIDVDVPATGLSVRADRRYARQVLTNLLGNASKYAPHGTTIAVRADQHDGEVRVSVVDRGPGIPADQLAGLFDRFYRMRRDAAEPGVGLGLAIAKGIVEAHGGRIGIDSEAGRGTTVWFTLPAVRGAVAA